MHSSNDVLEFETRLEEARKRMPGMQPFMMPSDLYIDLNDQGGAVSSVSQGKGYSCVDSMKPADSEQYLIVEMCSPRALSSTPRVEHDAHGSVTLQTIGTITARLSTPVEIILQTCFQMMPEWARPSCLAGRCERLDAVNRKTKTEETPKSRKPSPKSKVDHVLHWVSIICHLVKALFVSLSDLFFRGLSFAHDQGMPLLGRMTKFCMETCGHLREAASEGLNEVQQRGPLGALTNGCKQLIAWMKRLLVQVMTVKHRGFL